LAEKRDKLVRGSIRVFKDACFYEEREVQQINVNYENLTAILHVTSIPKDLQEIFGKAGIVWSPDTRNGCRLKGDIKGLAFDDIESADEDHLRIRFSGMTHTALKSKLNDAMKWLDVHKIQHGEKDGKAACIFKCLTSEQLEIGEF
jgi:hypothetical protein